MSLRDIAATSIEAQRSAAFLNFARHLCRAKGDLPLALRQAEHGRSVEDVLIILRSAVGAGTTSGVGWAQEITQYGNLVAAFSASLRNVGVFDSMLQYTKRVPLHTRTVVATTGATAGVIGEGQARPVSRLSLQGGTLAERVAVGILIVSDQLMKVGGNQADQLFSSELRYACTASLDSDFIATLISGTATTSQSGVTPEALLADVASAIASMSLDQNSRLFLIASGAFVQRMSVMATSIGSLSFPQLSPDGGSIGSLTVLPSDSVSGTSFIVADASQIAAASDVILLDASSEALIMADSSPSSPVTSADTLTSLWSQGLIGLKAQRYWGCERLRSTAVALVA